jgi:predicted small secreted protein
MKNKYLLPLLVVLVTSLLFTSCTNTQKQAIGNDDDIIVIADSLLFVDLEAELLHVFEKVIYTPQPENLFHLQRENIGKIRHLQNRKNIIVLGALNSNDQTSQYLREVLDSSVTKLIQNGEEFFINKTDLWAKDQLVMFIIGNSIEELKKKILDGNEELLYSFRNMSNERLFSKLYKPSLENKKVEAELLTKYGWSIYVQPGVELAKSDSINNFVWLRSGRNTPVERWIFVRWIDNADANYLNNDSLINIRDRTTQKYYRVSGDSVSVNISFGMSKPMVSQADFNGHYSLMSQGFWTFNDKSGGGPFISYSYLDEKTNRFYMIDASIFAPKYYKKKLIQQADVILNSFNTIDELSEERIEEILDELE